ncbi:MAG: hypothetical protein ABSG36_13125 [Acidimicrobiales bacterium]|jgi:chorismate-pyruvate lyase
MVVVGQRSPLDLALESATTVTALLEQLVGEPLDAGERLHAVVHAVMPNELEVAEGSLLLRRFALLRGRWSTQAFMQAESLIVPSRLPSSVCARLETTSDPIGRILAEEGLEFTRSALSAPQRSVASPPSCAVSAPPEILLTRTYRLDLETLPVMVITEWFLRALEPFLGSDRAAEPN